MSKAIVSMTTRTEEPETVVAQRPDREPAHQEPGMTSTLVRADSPRPASAARPRRPATRTGIKLALAVAALAILTVAGLTVAGLHWNLGAEPAAPAVPTQSGPSAAYLPGGSVYEQQVPDFQRWTLVYGPDGTVHKSQVPRAR